MRTRRDWLVDRATTVGPILERTEIATSFIAHILEQLAAEG
jgi:hypothetical protein